MARDRKYMIVGIDEAGRGPLAGPVAVAAVRATVTGPANYKLQITNYKQIPISKLQNGQVLKNIKDSKKLSEKQREEWFDLLKKNFEYKVAMVGPQVIDKVGIKRATQMAVNRVLRRIKKPDIVLLDGLLKAPSHYNQKTIIKGDEKIPLISAASIMAKVKRDRKMKRIHKDFPKYCFDCHKGYGTRAHYDRIKKHGFLEIHRKSYLKNEK